MLTAEDSVNFTVWYNWALKQSLAVFFYTSLDYQPNWSLSKPRKVKNETNSWSLRRFRMLTNSDGHHQLTKGHFDSWKEINNSFINKTTSIWILILLWICLSARIYLLTYSIHRYTVLLYHYSVFSFYRTWLFYKC